MVRARTAAAPTLQTEQRELECTLTESELLLRGEEMSSCELEIDKLKQQRRGLNGQIADLSEQRSRLATVIDTGKESRMVVCEWQPDWTAGSKTLVRTDTREHVTTEPISDDERQTELGLGEVTPIASAPSRRGSKNSSPTTTDHDYSDPT